MLAEMALHAGLRFWGDQVSGEPNTAVWKVLEVILGGLLEE